MERTIMDKYLPIGYEPPKYGYIERRSGGDRNLGYADISGWSHGTTRPIRPNVPDLPMRYSEPITSLRRLVDASLMPAPPHHPEDVVLPHVTERKVVVGDIGKSFRLEKDYWNRLTGHGLDVRPMAK